MARINNKKIDKFIEKEIYNELLKEFERISSVGGIDLFFNKFMTSGEKTLFFRRMAVIKLLNQNKKYREIKEILGISSGTISRVADIVAGRGYSINPNRKRKYSADFSKKPVRRRGLRYKGTSGFLDPFA